jgi:hypothetical protein
VEEGPDRRVPPVSGKGKEKEKEKEKGEGGLWAEPARLCCCGSAGPRGWPSLVPFSCFIFVLTFSFFYFLNLLYLLQNSFKSTQTKS